MGQGSGQRTTEEVTALRKAINTFLQGAGFYAFLNNETACFDNVELSIWYSYYLYINIFEPDTRDIFNSSVNYFKLWHKLSPIARGCYVFQESNTQ